MVVLRSVAWNEALANNRLWFFGTLAVICALACASCGSSNGLQPVSGKVFHQGNPAIGATVYFHRKGVTEGLQESAP